LERKGGRGAAKEAEMKQTIILLTTVILGIAISAMILTFRDTTESIVSSTRSTMETQLKLE
jgi:hypothetical protein